MDSYYFGATGGGSGPISPALAAQLEVLRERDSQRLEFGVDVDDALLPAEWIARLAKHLGRAVSTDPDVYRRQLVIVGALALAAIEAYDRNVTVSGRESP